jgi:hypothetical protein
VLESVESVEFVFLQFKLYCSVLLGIFDTYINFSFYISIYCTIHSTFLYSIYQKPVTKTRNR